MVKNRNNASLTPTESLAGQVCPGQHCIRVGSNWIFDVKLITRDFGIVILLSHLKQDTEKVCHYHLEVMFLN